MVGVHYSRSLHDLILVIYHWINTKSEKPSYINIWKNIDFICTCFSNYFSYSEPFLLFGFWSCVDFRWWSCSRSESNENFPLTHVDHRLDCVMIHTNVWVKRGSNAEWSFELIYDQIVLLSRENYQINRRDTFVVSCATICIFSTCFGTRFARLHMFLLLIKLMQSLVMIINWLWVVRFFRA